MATSRTVRISGMPSRRQVSDSRLEELFDGFGSVQHWERKLDRNAPTGETTLAFVMFATREEALAAIEGLQGLEIIEGSPMSARLWYDQTISERLAAGRR